MYFLVPHILFSIANDIVEAVNITARYKVARTAGRGVTLDLVVAPIAVCGMGNRRPLAISLFTCITCSLSLAPCVIFGLCSLFVTWGAGS